MRLPWRLSAFFDAGQLISCGGEYTAQLIPHCLRRTPAFELLSGGRQRKMLMRSVSLNLVTVPPDGRPRTLLAFHSPHGLLPTCWCSMRWAMRLCLPDKGVVAWITYFLIPCQYRSIQGPFAHWTYVYYMIAASSRSSTSNKRILTPSTLSIAPCEPPLGPDH